MWAKGESPSEMRAEFLPQSRGNANAGYNHPNCWNVTILVVNDLEPICIHGSGDMHALDGSV